MWVDRMFYNYYNIIIFFFSNVVLVMQLTVLTEVLMKTQVIISFTIVVNQQGVVIDDHVH